MQNEFQNAYEVSKELQRQDNALDIPEGMVALIGYSLAYCRFTDATLPNPNRRVLRLFASRRIAEHIAARENSRLGEEYDGEAWYGVLPKLPEPVRPVRTWNDDDLPF
jgi:hypothetical protein